MPDDATRLTVNGRPVTTGADPNSALIYLLRNELRLKGVRAGCGIGECGACTVICDGAPLRSCSTPLSAVGATEVTTPEGLGGPENPHPVQQAFLDQQAAQCGYCINGMIMTVTALIERGETPEALADALQDHLCRCGTHTRILAAVQRATGHESAEQQSGTAGSQHCSCGPWSGLPALIETAPDVQAWLQLTQDGTIRALAGRVELGQGIRTAFGQLVAAQIGVTPQRVTVVPAFTGGTPDTAYTAGSMSTEIGGTALAAAAVAFRRLVALRASGSLGVPAADVTLDDEGATAAGRVITWQELASDGTVTGLIEPGDRPHWHGGTLGTGVARDDLRPKLTGASAYIHDVDLDGMLHARALLPPSYEAQLTSIDVDAVAALPGVRTIVVDGRVVIVVAEREEQAVRAATGLAQTARWNDHGLRVDRDVPTTLRGLPARSASAREDAGVEGALENAAHRLSAAYTRPYQAHAAMAPSCAVALLKDRFTVWTSSQGIYPLQRELAALLEIDEHRVEVRHVDGPGCYGHDLADDAAAYAILAAQAVPGTPVRFQFSVEDAFVWDPYGPAMLVDVEAGLDESGQMVAWRHRSRTDLHTTRPSGAGDRLIPSWLGGTQRARPWTGPHEQGMRDAIPLYDLDVVDAVVDFVQGPLRSGALRSLASHMNIFAIESFVDELAEAAGQDPVAFRLAHLRDQRARDVLSRAADAAGWVPHVGPSGRGQGVAVARYKGTKAYVAEVVDATVDQQTADVTVQRIVVAADAGAVVNIDGLRNQLEGGALQGLSRALYEEVRIDHTGILSRDWTTYPVLRFNQVPRLEVIVDHAAGGAPLGAGESSTPPLAPALANAIDDGIGLRLRDLPFTPQRIRRRLEELSDVEGARLRLD